MFRPVWLEALMNLRLFTQYIFIVFATSGCVSQSAQQRDYPRDMLANHAVAVISRADSCAAAIAASRDNGTAELDAGSIDLLIWNIQKGQNAGWLEDLHRFSGDKDLVLIQEAVLQTAVATELTPNTYWSFAPGFQTTHGISGVVTFSTVQPLVQCNLSTKEPWLRTPKATNIAEYGLKDRDDSLLVVNIHAVNLTFGVRALAEQLEQIRLVLAAHQGPVIFSGDFNTWSTKRQQVVNELVDSQRLTALSFNEDHRLRVFGNPMDHVYVRGLTSLEAISHPVDTSDHNPMSVKLML